LSHRICTGIGRRKLGKLIEELAGPWLAQQESRLRDRRGRDRLWTLQTRLSRAGNQHRQASTAQDTPDRRATDSWPAAGRKCG
jgi:hypothetical protein